MLLIVVVAAFVAVAATTGPAFAGGNGCKSTPRGEVCASGSGGSGGGGGGQSFSDFPGDSSDSGGQGSQGGGSGGRCEYEFIFIVKCVGHLP